MSKIVVGHHKKSGFTLVELLIVIVVIAILAAITIVAYNNVSQRAKNSAIDASVAQSIKILHLYYTEFGKWPKETMGSTPPDSYNHYAYIYCIGLNYPVTNQSPNAPATNDDSPTVIIPRQACSDGNGTIHYESSWFDTVLKTYGTASQNTELSVMPAAATYAPVYWVQMVSGFAGLYHNVAGFTYPTGVDPNYGPNYFVTYSQSGSTDCSGVQYSQKIGEYSGHTNCIVMLEFYGL